ncbi:hypothetical protein [Streptomyces sp. RFCAC02]|uniref:hypothetical protein n=1 Tax=Streptomyces sp. RFCAC02 TaxID=2499143 RepID=UPI001020E98E|nr:hypothetical protein [Streptomyces sp. RFCAC02]
MRPERFQQFAIATYQAAGLRAEPWADGTTRPHGVRLHLPSGAEIRHAITAQAREGDRYDGPEEPVEKDAPEPVTVPELGEGRVALTDVERHLAALLTNTGLREMARCWAYSDREQAPKTPGVGCAFHNGAKIFTPFVHAAGPGKSPGPAYDMPQEI